MIEIIKDLPGNVVAFEAVGEVTAADYKEILDPAVASAIEQFGDINVLYILGDRFTGYSGAAMWDDAIVGTEHWKHWKKIAVVTNTPWVTHAIHAIAWMVPARIKLFTVAEKPAAVEWICS
ncbi:MAG: STAS/SEC14 domain-containing protein [Candidatus Nanopelagicales bacterium]|nr:STAS/SEC14 domain-containing protein [Candidatus Nanopelagicales bacterium]MCF8538989.1 STAS/SEC14 domain-containing protein [Candidatus Nanopelagicales bacterium]MCF8551752.1 STAS/SEC14 domain-containing protein [Candidatus Nanopelagicales bacterium]